MAGDDSIAAGRAGTRTRWFALSLACLVPAMITALGWSYSPPMLNPDSAMGFLTWNSVHAGAPWNHLRSVDPQDIARDQFQFLAWWSPGQYELPGLLRLAHLSWGHVILLTALAGAWAGAIGSWKLARAVGASPATSAWFVAANTLQWHTLFHFGHFRGGDVLIGAVAPWFLLLAWQLRRSPWAFVVCAPIILIFGFYLKLSSVLFTVPLLTLCGLANFWFLRPNWRLLAVWIAAIVLGGAVTWATLHYAFVSRAPNPGDSVGPASNALNSISFALSSPWLAMAGLQSLVGRICWWAHVDADVLWATKAWTVLPFTVAIASGVAWLTAGARPDIRWSAFTLSLLSFAALAVLLCRGSNIGLDDRYMRPTATALLLLVALQLDSPDATRRRVSLAILAVIGLFGAAAAVQRSVTLARMDARSPEDITQQHMKPAAIARLHAFDTARENSLIYIPCPEIAVEIHHQRVLVTDDFSVVRGTIWQGCVPSLVVALPDEMESDGRGAVIRKNFRGYDDANWKDTPTAGWHFWTVVPKSPNHPL